MLLNSGGTSTDFEFPNNYSEFLFVRPVTNKLELLKACRKTWRIHAFVEQFRNESGGWEHWEKWLETAEDAAVAEIIRRVNLALATEVADCDIAAIIENGGTTGRSWDE